MHFVEEGKKNEKYIKTFLTTVKTAHIVSKKSNKKKHQRLFLLASRV